MTLNITNATNSKPKAYRSANLSFSSFQTLSPSAAASCSLSFSFSFTALISAACTLPACSSSPVASSTAIDSFAFYVFKCQTMSCKSCSSCFTMGVIVDSSYQVNISQPPANTTSPPKFKPTDRSQKEISNQKYSRVLCLLVLLSTSDTSSQGSHRSRKSTMPPSSRIGTGKAASTPVAPPNTESAMKLGPPPIGLA